MSAAIKMRARMRRRQVLQSMTWLEVTRRAQGTDPLTGAVVYGMAEGPAVHWSGAVPAYPWGMPDVPAKSWVPWPGY